MRSSQEWLRLDVQMASGSLDTPSISMNTILSFIQSQDIFAWVGALVALLSAVIAVASLIPGDEPEATLTKIVSFLSKFSKK